MFDVYFARELPDEGEALLAFLDGELYESSRAHDTAARGEMADAIAHWAALASPESDVIDTGGGEARYVAIPLDGRVQDGLFVAANFPEFERGEIDAAVRAAILVQVVTLVIASLIGLFLAGRVLRPLRSLATTARSISDADLTQRIPVSGRDEASQIADAFNDMLTRLERSFMAQRQFLNDTSHQLRTPLTIIRGHIELLELDESPEARRQTIELVTDEIDRLTRMVNDLFVLARAERPDFLSVETLDLAGLLDELHRKVTTLAARDWQLDAQDPVVVRGDRQRLTQAVMALVENAVRHTDEGATIRLGTAMRGGVGVLWVEDTGSGVPAAQSEAIFHRTGTGEPSQEGGGAGLGLAIVRAIAEAHKGSARLVSHAGPGALFEIAMPIADDIAAPRPAAGGHGRPRVNAAPS